MTGRQQLCVGTDDGQPQGLEFQCQSQMQDLWRSERRILQREFFRGQVRLHRWGNELVETFLRFFLELMNHRVTIVPGDLAMVGSICKSRIKIGHGPRRQNGYFTPLYHKPGDDACAALHAIPFYQSGRVEIVVWHAITLSPSE